MQIYPTLFELCFDPSGMLTPTGNFKQAEQIF